MTAPDKSGRKGISVLEAVPYFADEDKARKWIEGIIWQDGVPTCHRCHGTNTYAVKSNPNLLPYRCRDCQKHFSVRTGTLLQGSPLPFSKWALAIYLFTTSLKGISSMQLHRDIGVTQKTAWFMLQRLRAACTRNPELFEGLVAVDETPMGPARTPPGTSTSGAVKDAQGASRSSSASNTADQAGQEAGYDRHHEPAC